MAMLMTGLAILIGGIGVVAVRIFKWGAVTVGVIMLVIALVVGFYWLK